MHVVHIAVAVFPHVAAAVAGRHLCYSSAVAVRRIVGVDRLLRALKQGNRRIYYCEKKAFISNF